MINLMMACIKAETCSCSNDTLYEYNSLTIKYPQVVFGFTLPIFTNATCRFHSPVIWTQYAYFMYSTEVTLPTQTPTPGAILTWTPGMSTISNGNLWPLSRGLLVGRDSTERAPNTRVSLDKYTCPVICHFKVSLCRNRWGWLQLATLLAA